MNTRSEDFTDTPAASRFRADAAHSMEEDRSTRSILRELMQEVPNLFTKELALARAEMRENVEQTRRGAIEVSARGGGQRRARGVLLLGAL